MVNQFYAVLDFYYLLNCWLYLKYGWIRGDEQEAAVYESVVIAKLVVAWAIKRLCLEDDG